jgi:FkbM family methyltransferase
MVTVVNRRTQRVADNKKLFDILEAKGGSKYLFGATPFSRIAIKNLKEEGIQVDGVIDDFWSDKYFCGLEVFKLSDISNKDALIVQAVGAKPKIVFNVLKKNGFENILDYYLLYLRDEKRYKLIHGGDNFVEDYLLNERKYNEVYNKLEDDKSRFVFVNLLDLKLNLDMQKSIFGFSVNQQYWEDFVGMDQNKIFVDCGGFDGDSTISFINRQPDYKKVYFFEPFVKCMELARRNLNQYPNVEFHNIAVSDEKSKIYFTEDLGVANHQSEEGTLEVETNTLDNIIKDKVDYIKFDIEGDEYRAIKGARTLITRYKPKIAVAVYHKVEDLWKIPELVLSMNSGYKMYLRHYTEGLSESIMYFI